MLDAVVRFAVLPMLLAALVIAVLRLLRGPTLPDRVVALDLVTTISIAVIAAFAVATGEAVFIDIVLAVALVAFLGTVGFAYYLEQRGGDG